MQTQELKERITFIIRNIKISNFETKLNVCKILLEKEQFLQETTNGIHINFKHLSDKNINDIYNILKEE